MPSFANADRSFFGQAGGLPARVVAPLTGTTITLRTHRVLVVNPAGTIAALTIKLPAAQPGEKVEILFRQTVTALTVQDSRGTTVTGLGASTIGTLMVARYVSKTLGWLAWK
jgi:phytoene dehydrogenase-like protein